MSTISRTIEGIALRRSSDAQVFDCAMRGDSLAFSEVYRRYHGRVYAFCLSRLLSREAASDATQEVFLRALSANPASVRAPGAWLFGVARHVCMDVTARGHRDAPAETSDLGSDETALSTATSAEDGALSKQAAASVLLALRRTNARYRSALILREIHQQPMKDVAETMGVSVSVSYTILSRARDAFGKAYAEVLNLPAACRSAVEMIYRRSGTGLSATENSALEMHLDNCERCRREASRAEGGKGLRALLPLLPFAPVPRPSILARAAAAFGSQAWPSQIVATAGTQWTAAKVAAVAIAAGGLITAVATTAPPASLGVEDAVAPTRLEQQRAEPTAQSQLGAQGERARVRLHEAGGNASDVAAARGPLPNPDEEAADRTGPQSPGQTQYEAPLVKSRPSAGSSSGAGGPASGSYGHETDSAGGLGGNPGSVDSAGEAVGGKPGGTDSRGDVGEPRGDVGPPAEVGVGSADASATAGGQAQRGH